MKKSRNGSVSYNCKEYIGTIEFYHPKGNSLPGNLLRDIAKTITSAGEDEECRVIVLKSSGDGAFCAGASIHELKTITNIDEGKEFFMGFAHVINAMRTCPKMIITRVHGKTIGGGVGLVAASDFVIAKDGSSVKLSELALGIGPFVVGPAVGRKIGISAFATLSMDATTWYSAEWAQSKGLYNKLALSTEELDEMVNQLSANLASSNPEALLHLKEIHWQATGHWDATLEQRAEISGKLILSDHTKNFMKKFFD